MINNKTDIIGYMQLFFKFWPIGSPEEAYYMEYKGDFSKPLNEDFFKYILGSFGKICEEQDEKKRINVYLKENISITRHTFLNVLLTTKTSANKGQDLELAYYQEKSL